MTTIYRLTVQGVWASALYPEPEQMRLRWEHAAAHFLSSFGPFARGLVRTNTTALDCLRVAQTCSRLATDAGEVREDVHGISDASGMFAASNTSYYLAVLIAAQLIEPGEPEPEPSPEELAVLLLADAL